MLPEIDTLIATSLYASSGTGIRETSLTPGAATTYVNYVSHHYAKDANASKIIFGWANDSSVDVIPRMARLYTYLPAGYARRYFTRLIDRNTMITMTCAIPFVQS